MTAPQGGGGATKTTADPMPRNADAAGRPRRRDRAFQVGAWFLSVYVIAAIQASIQTPLDQLTLASAVGRGDVVAALMLIYIAVIFDPTTNQYLKSKLDEDEKHFYTVALTCAYLSGFIFLFASRSYSPSSPWMIAIGMALCVIYLAIPTFVMVKRSSLPSAVSNEAH